MSTTTPPKRGVQARTRRRREQIANAVLEIVDTAGYEAVTTAGVATQAQMSEPTVLYHFPTKDHLLVAALDRAEELAAEGLNIDSPDVWLDLDQLRQVAVRVRQDDQRTRLYLMLRGQAMVPAHPAAEYLRERDRRVREIYAHLIRQRQAAGLAHPGVDPDLAAVQMLALYDGLTALWMQTPDFDIGEALVAGLRRLLGENIMALRAAIEDPGGS